MLKVIGKFSYTEYRTEVDSSHSCLIYGLTFQTEKLVLKVWSHNQVGLCAFSWRNFKFPSSDGALPPSQYYARS